MTAPSGTTVVLPTNPDVLVVVQARMGSSRLPGKILMPVAGRPMLVFLLERLRRALPWPVIVATTDNSLDDDTEKTTLAAGVAVVRGSEADVFSRFQRVAELTGCRHIVRLTGDNPLIDTKLVNFCVAAHIADEAELTSTREVSPEGVVTRYVPKGQSVDVIKAVTLKTLRSENLTSFEREHLIPAFFRPEFRFKLNILRDAKTSEEPLSVDTEEDYQRLLKLVGR